MGSPVCAAAEAGTKTPTRSAEMAKRAPDTAPENRWIFTSSSIFNLTSPSETHHRCGDGQDKSISGPFDNSTFASAASSTTRTRALRGHGADNRPKALGLKIPETFLLRADEVIE